MLSPPRIKKSPYGDFICGDDVPKLEPKRQFRRFTIWTLDPIIKELRDMFKQHPEWFEVPQPKSTKGKNEIDYFM